jgi:predicted permease
MNSFINDARCALRSLWKHPAFALVSVITLSLGIGANTAVFTVLNAVMLRALPVKDPDRLVFLSNPDRHGVNGGQETGSRFLFAYHEFEWLRDHNQVFSEIFAVQSVLSTPPVIVEGAGRNGESERARISAVSGAYFSGLGVKPILGQTFSSEIDKANASNALAVISYDYWKNRFAFDPKVVSRRVRVRETSFEIIGVAQPGFSGETVGSAPDFWIPLQMETEVSKEVLTPPKDIRNKYMWLQVMARLKPGVTIGQANASVNLTLQQMLRSEAGQLSESERAGFLNQQIALVSGNRGASTLRTSFDRPLSVVMGLVALVLLIACANVANLFLARTVTRQKEFALRSALGAGRRHLAQQVLMEGLLLAVMSGFLGLLLAQWADGLLIRLVSPAANQIPLDIHPDARILGFTIGISLLTAVLFGLGPAMRASRADLNGLLKGSAKGTTGISPAGRVPTAKILVIGQVALSFVCLITMGLFLRSFQNLSHTNVGYDSEHLLQFSVSPTKSYQGVAVDQLHQQLLERFRAIPGVRGASLSLTGLFSNIDLGMNVSIDGYKPPSAQQPVALNDFVGPNYFSTADIPILLGREIGPQDEGRGPLVGMINQTMARTYFGDANPIGHRVKATAPTGALDFEIVGVVADSKHDDLRTPPGSWFYTPYFHVSRHANFSWAINEVRISSNSSNVITAIRAAVKEASPMIEAPEIRGLNELMGETVATERMITTLCSFFGLLAILLACIGLYGVMSYNVATRTNEFGIRLALGAQPRKVFELIARQGMTLVLIGLMIGLATAFALTRVIRSLLFEVSPTDFTTFLGVALLLSAVALLACCLPARRATRVDPLVALRYE